jgi:hypothetical protein
MVFRGIVYYDVSYLEIHMKGRQNNGKTARLESRRQYVRRYDDKSPESMFGVTIEISILSKTRQCASFYVNGKKWKGPI